MNGNRKRKKARPQRCGQKKSKRRVNGRNEKDRNASIRKGAEVYVTVRLANATKPNTDMRTSEGRPSWETERMRDRERERERMKMDEFLKYREIKERGYGENQIPFTQLCEMKVEKVVSKR